MATKAFELLDTDKDGSLSEQELEKSPGLKYSAHLWDDDKDKKISRDELVKRFQEYQKSRLAYVTYSLGILYKNKPLAGAKVRLVPEPFLEGIIEPSEAISDGMGGVRPVTASRTDDPGLVRVGFYRVEVTSDAVKIAPKYNTETTLGVEVMPFTNPLGRPMLDVGKK